MKRLVQPEILDSLPENHPDAVANRRDLRLINALMGNFGWFGKELAGSLLPDDRILEIGAGTGELGQRLRARLRNYQLRYCGLDLWSRPATWPEKWDWRQENLLESEEYQNTTVLLANLILHQFKAGDLRNLGDRINASPIRLILASEPARRPFHQKQLLLLRPLGLHPISRHDGRVSVAAGFLNDELPQLLGLDPRGWTVRCSSGFLGWNRMVAQRKASA